MFDPVINRIAHDMRQRIADRLDHLAVDLDIAALDAQLHRFPNRARCVADETREECEQALDRLHPCPCNCFANIADRRRYPLERRRRQRIDIRLAQLPRQFVARQHQV